jgi:hypothetical protein
MTYLKNRIVEAVTTDQHYVQVIKILQHNDIQHKYKDYKLEENEILLFWNKVYVLNSQELRNLVLTKMHNVPYTGHLGYRKNITTVRCQYFWPGIKNDVTEYLARCMKCQKVKVEHMHSMGLLQSLLISE